MNFFIYYLTFCILKKLFIYYLTFLHFYKAFYLLSNLSKKFAFLSGSNINGAYKLKRLKFNNERIERYN